MALIAGGSVQAASYRVLYAFPTNCNPSAPVVQGRDGAFYGTTDYGGDQQDGMVFRLTADGAMTDLVNFNYANGAYPAAGLVLGPDGAFYGTTGSGGPKGNGTVFRVTPEGDFATIGAFGVVDGQAPRGLVVGSDGFLYGTTVSGGAYQDQRGYGYGTVFRITTNGFLTTLVSFAGTNGWAPMAGLVQGDDGAFYGTTRFGGGPTNDLPSGYGVVFRVTTNGVLSTLAVFNGTNGSYPFAGLVKGRDGMLYGTTTGGGTVNWGTVFRVTTTGQFTTLVSFDPSTGGIDPEGGLVQGSDGAFYGTTSQGTFSSIGYGGAVYRMTTNGLLSWLHPFGGLDGRWPEAPLIQGSEGAFYGTCMYGGSAQNGGIVFRLDLTVQLALPKPVAQGLEVSFNGLPYTAYLLQRATDPSGPWSFVSTVVPDDHGLGTWLDSSPPTGRAFYRTSIP